MDVVAFHASRRFAETPFWQTSYVERGVRRVDGAKLFFPEEFPEIIAEEARQLWGAA